MAPLDLSMDVTDNDLQFSWKPAGSNEWQAIGPVLDAGVISDEGGRGEHGSFTAPLPHVLRSIPAGEADRRISRGLGIFRGDASGGALIHEYAGG